MALIAFPMSFGYEPIFKDLCSNLSAINLDFNDSNMNISYQNLTEFPKEVLDILNSKIHNNSDLTTLLKGLGEVTFSAEINYNTTSCFSGSIAFKNSSIVSLKLEPDELKGTNNSHIYFHAELVNLESIINDIIAFSKKTNPGFFETISVGAKTFGAVIFGFFRNDLSVKPITGLFKVIDLLKVLPELQASQAMAQAINSTMNN
jgi:hypothetical protein